MAYPCFSVAWLLLITPLLASNVLQIGAASYVSDCESNKLSVRAKCLFELRQSGLSDAAKFATSKCGDATATVAQNLTCTRLGFPSSKDEWKAFAERRNRICKPDVVSPWEVRCRVACVGVDWNICSRFYHTSDTLFDMELVLRTSAFKVPTTVGSTPVEVVTSANNIVVALMRHSGLLVTSLAQMLVASDLTVGLSWLRYVAWFVGVFSYGFTGAWLQFVLQIASLSAILGPHVRHVNSVGIAGLGFATAVSIIVVDAADSAFITWYFTFALLVGVFALSLGIYQKRILVDTTVIYTFIITEVNVFKSLGDIIAYQSQDNAFIALVLYLFSALLPYGDLLNPFSYTMAYRSWSIVAIITKIFTIDDLTQTLILGGLFVWSYVVFAFARAVVGYMLTRRVREWSVQAQLFRGFMLVWLDWTAPFDLVSKGIGLRSTRNFNYIMVVGVLKLLEVCFAPDLAALSLIATMFVYIVQWEPYRVGRTLSCFKEVARGGDYACLGALPWVSLSNLVRLADSVHRVVVSTAEGQVRGVACVLKRSGATFLHTVSHVWPGGESKVAIVDGNDEVELHTEASAYVVHGISEDDPPVTGRIEDSSILSGDAPEVSFLTEGEVSSVASLVTIHPSRAVNAASKFKFNLDQGTIEAAIDLTHGDSGSPVFGILRNGTIRLAGVVSRGVREYGSGNIISSFVRKNPLRAGSPGLGDATVTAVDDAGPGHEVAFPVKRFCDEVTALTTELRDIAAKGKYATPEQRKRRAKAREEAVGKLATLHPYMGPFDYNKALAAINGSSIVEFNVARSGNIDRATVARTMARTFVKGEANP